MAWQKTLMFVFYPYYTKKIRRHGLTRYYMKDYCLAVLLDHLKQFFPSSSNTHWRKIEQHFVPEGDLLSLLLAYPSIKARNRISHPTIAVALMAWAHFQNSTTQATPLVKLLLPLEVFTFLITNYPLNTDSLLILLIFLIYLTMAYFSLSDFLGRLIKYQL